MWFCYFSKNGRVKCSAQPSKSGHFYLISHFSFTNSLSHTLFGNFFCIHGLRSRSKVREVAQFMELQTTPWSPAMTPVEEAAKNNVLAATIINLLNRIESFFFFHCVLQRNELSFFGQFVFFFVLIEHIRCSQFLSFRTEIYFY